MIKLITVSPPAVVGVRSAIAAAVIALFIRRWHFSLSFSQLGGAVAITAAQFFFVLATRQTTAANAVFIQFTAPVYVAFFGWWYLKERARPVDWASTAVVIAGLLLFFQGELDRTSLWGNVNALVSGIALAWFFLFMRKQKGDAAIHTVFLGNVLAALCFLPFIFFAAPTPGDWAALLFLGVLQMGLPFVLLSISLKQLRALEAILIQTVEPVLNPLRVVLILGERPSGWALVGGLLVLSAVGFRALALRPSA